MYNSIVWSCNLTAGYNCNNLLYCINMWNLLHFVYLNVISYFKVCFSCIFCNLISEKLKNKMILLPNIQSKSMSQFNLSQQSSQPVLLQMSMSTCNKWLVKQLNLAVLFCFQQTYYCINIWNLLHFVYLNVISYFKVCFSCIFCNLISEKLKNKMISQS
jgi:dolichyl-phosphate-mannose--protein O-mannosyl transferase